MKCEVNHVVVEMVFEVLSVPRIEYSVVRCLDNVPTESGGRCFNRVECRPGSCAPVPRKLAWITSQPSWAEGISTELNAAQVFLYTSTACAGITGRQHAWITSQPSWAEGISSQLNAAQVLVHGNHEKLPRFGARGPRKITWITSQPS